MISIESAQDTILENCRVLESVDLEILDALDHVLAEDVTSDTDIPPFDNSAMDGYAVLADDVSSATEDSPVELKVLEDIPAGHVGSHAVVAGTATRIMTGAPLPEGADSVVMVEHTRSDKDAVRVMKPIDPGANVRRRGEDVHKGDVVLEQGDVLTPARVGLLAAVGRATVSVIRKPVIGVLSTGDELVEVGEPLKPGKIRNSNSYALSALVAAAGAAPRRLGIARDTEEDLVAAIERGLECDALITTGGVSVGDYDLVKSVLERMGEMVFWKVAMKPGRPLAFGVIQGAPVVGLPGNPTSCMVSFEQFVRPMIRKMSGRTGPGHAEIEALATDDIRNKKPGLRYFLTVTVEHRDGVWWARPVGPRGSGMVNPIAAADGLLMVPEGETGLAAGEKATVQLLPGFEQ